MNEVADSSGATDLVSLIDALIQPAAPPPVSMWPQTWGWAVVAAALAALIVALAWRGLRRWRANAYRRAAIAELDAAGDDPAAIAAILRRAALAAWPREEVAGLSGSGWTAFLSRTGRADFSGAAGAALVQAPYAGTPAATPALSAAARLWLRSHRAEARR